MARKPTAVLQVPPAPATGFPAAAVLESVLAAVRPTVRLLLQSGIDYPHFVSSLKALFIYESQAELQRAGNTPTDSATSLLSGVHRKDVRAWRLTGQTAGGGKPVAVSARVFARWIADPAYADAQGRPR